MEPSRPVKTGKPSERFKVAMQQILSVQKSDLVRREAEYQKDRTEKRKQKKAAG